MTQSWKTEDINKRSLTFMTETPHLGKEYSPMKTMIRLDVLADRLLMHFLPVTSTYIAVWWDQIMT